MVSPVIPDTCQVKELPGLVDPPRLEHVLPPSLLADTIHIDDRSVIPVYVRKIPASQLNTGVLNNREQNGDIGDASGDEGGGPDHNLPVTAGADVVGEVSHDGGHPAHESTVQHLMVLEIGVQRKSTRWQPPE